MRYVQLRAFHYVAVHGGFSRAAKALYVTQPAISDQIRKLEAEYDVRLFDRQKKQVVVTRQGRELLEITHRLFETEQHALDYLTQSRVTRTGTLRLMADSVHHLTDILGEFRASHPAVFVSVQVGNSEQVIASLDSYEADIGVIGELPDGRNHDIIHLSSTPIVAFAPIDSDYACRSSITLRELLQLPLVLRESGSKTRARFEYHAAQAKLPVIAGIEAEGREAVCEIVAAGGGVGIVSEAEFSRGRALKKLPISDIDITMDEALVCLRERAGSQLIRLFMELANESKQNSSAVL